MSQDKFYLEKVFPETDKVFSIEYKNIEEIKDSCIYILDTNVLLVPFLKSKESVDDFQKIFEGLKKNNKLLLPARVAREFAKNRGQKIADAYNKIVTLKSKLDSSNIQFDTLPFFEGNTDY